MADLEYCMTMLTPALSELQEPSKFSELRMESVQSHFLKIQNMPKCEPFASVPLLRHSAAFCAECPRHCDEPAYHISSVICWRPLSDHVIQWCLIKVSLAAGFHMGSMVEDVCLLIRLSATIFYEIYIRYEVNSCCFG